MYGIKSKYVLNLSLIDLISIEELFEYNENRNLCHELLTDSNVKRKMSLRKEVDKLNNFHFFKPMRAIFSGSSQSGKTNLIGGIMKNQKRLFGEDFSSIKYFYPEYLDDCPVDWHNFIETPISYKSGFPSKNDIDDLEPNSCIIIDDMMTRVVKSELMRQFFNVISGKRSISIICVTQNYFVQGPFSRDIRNSTNFVCLFRNCADDKLNKRVAVALGITKAFSKAEEEVFQTQVYPYIFIDQTQRNQIYSWRVYTDILSKIRIAYNLNGMKGFVLPESEFLKTYRIIEEKLKSVSVVEYENKKKLLRDKVGGKSETRKEKRKRLEKVKKRLDFD